jgi:hypothetical protein
MAVKTPGFGDAAPSEYRLARMVHDVRKRASKHSQQSGCEFTVVRSSISQRMPSGMYRTVYIQPRPNIKSRKQPPSMSLHGAARMSIRLARASNRHSDHLRRCKKSQLKFV